MSYLFRVFTFLLLTFLVSGVVEAQSIKYFQSEQLQYFVKGNGNNNNNNNADECPAPPPANEQTNVIINELNNSDNWIEFYIPPGVTVDFDDWELELNSTGGNPQGNAEVEICDDEEQNCIFSGGTNGSFVVFGDIPDAAIAAGINYIEYDSFDLHQQIQEIILTDGEGQLVHYLSYNNNGGNTNHFEKEACIDDYPDLVTVISNPTDNNHFCTANDGDNQISNGDYTNWNGCTSTTIGTSNDTSPQDIILSSNIIEEYDAFAGATVGALSISPASDGTPTFTILTDANDATYEGTCDNGIGDHDDFVINGTTLEVDSDNNLIDGIYTICMGVTDPDGNKFKKNLTITVNDTPVDANFFNIDEDEIYENLVFDGAAVGSFFAADLGVSMDLTYALLNTDDNTQTGSCSAGAPHNSYFEISNGGELLFDISAYLAVGDYTICVRADSAEGHSIRKNFVITILPVVNGTNFFSISNTTVSESDAAIGDIIGTLAPADDGAALSLAFELTDNLYGAVGTCAVTNTNWRFEIVNNNVQVQNTEGAAYLAPGDYTICVGATDENGVRYLKNITITVEPESAVCSHYVITDVEAITSATEQTFTVSALTDAGTSCAPNHAGLKPVTIDFTYVSPSTGSQGIYVTGTAPETLVTSGIGFNTNLNFDSGTGTATFVVSYDDAGQVQLSVADQNNVIATGNDAFVVVPNSLVLSMKDAGDNDLSTVLHLAEQPFNLKIEALNADRDPTPNYQPGQLMLDTTITAPAGANTVNLTYGSGNMATTDKSVDYLADPNDCNNWQAATATFANGEYLFSSATLDNVGEFEVNVCDANYLGYEISSAELVSGVRLTPAYFSINEVTAPQLQNTRGDFTYIDETFGFTSTPEYQFTARTYANTVATNYEFNFAEFGFTTPVYIEQSGYTVFESAVPAINVADGVTFDGHAELTLNANFRYIKDTNLVSPIDVALDLDFLTAHLSDADNIGYDSDGINSDNPVYEGYEIDISEAQVRYGRLFVDNGYGSESVDYKLNVVMQYYDDGTWVTNTEDNTTDFSGFSTELTDITNGSNYSSTTDTTSGSTFTQGVISGKSGIYIDTLNTPAEVFVEFDGLNNLFNFDWDGDGDIDADDKPSATIIFGNYRGNDRIIYKREL